jgi:hypothetical protein
MQQKQQVLHLIHHSKSYQCLDIETGTTGHKATVKALVTDVRINMYS